MSRAARVLHVLSGMNRGGIETWLMNVLRGLDTRRVCFDVLVEATEECAYDAEILARGGRILRSPAFRHRGRSAARMAQVLRAEGPYAVVHAHGRHDMAWPISVARALGVPVRIGHVHNLKDLHTQGPIRRTYKRVARRLLQANATWILGSSAAALESLYGAGALARHGSMAMLPYGIDMSRFVRRPSRERISAELDLPPGARLAGHVGRFVWEKNHTFLIEVFAALAARDPSWILLLVGDGPLRPQIAKDLADRGLAQRVRFTGVRDDIPDLMSAMDVFVFPSCMEGFGLVLVEAQALGVPCVIAQNIPVEVDVDQALVTRLPLEIRQSAATGQPGPAAGQSADAGQPGPAAWADATERAAAWADAIGRAAATPPRAAEAHALVAQSHFNIERSVEILLRSYYQLADA